jgi:hypothetical protein
MRIINHAEVGAVSGGLMGSSDPTLLKASPCTNGVIGGALGGAISGATAGVGGAALGAAGGAIGGAVAGCVADGSTSSSGELGQLSDIQAP